MELPEVERVRPEIEHVIRRARRRGRRTVEVRGQETAVRGAGVEALLRRGAPGEHGRAVESADLRAGERGAVVEDVVRLVVPVRPDTELGVVGERDVSVVERVAVVRAGGIARGRDGDALQVRRRRNGELADDPAVGEPVVLDRGVAVVICLAPTAEAAPERVRVRGAVEDRAGLAEHGELLVDDLDVVVRPHVPVRIGRGGVDGRARKAGAESFEADTGCGRSRAHRRAGLDRGVRCAGRDRRWDLVLGHLVDLLLRLERLDRPQCRRDVLVRRPPHFDVSAAAVVRRGGSRDRDPQQRR